MALWRSPRGRGWRILLAPLLLGSSKRLPGADVALANRSRFPDRRPRRLARGERGHADAPPLRLADLRAADAPDGAVDRVAHPLAADRRRGGPARADERRGGARDPGAPGAAALRAGVHGRAALAVAAAARGL